LTCPYISPILQMSLHLWGVAEGKPMPARPGKKSIEIPQSLWEALDAAARRQDMPTGAMAAVWLWEQLEAKARIPGGPAEGLHAPQPYHQRSIYPRRGDDHMEQAYDSKLAEHARFIAAERGE
jgi:hypothetical protein